MLTNHERLERQIEELVRAHLEGCRKAAAAAVDRAFAAAAAEPAPMKRRTKAAPRVQRPPRSPEELARLEEMLYAAVCETPGETMSVLAARLGMPSRRLEVPIKRLKRAGRVRSVGQRNLARYFPMAEERAAKAKLVAVGKES